MRKFVSSVDFKLLFLLASTSGPLNVKVSDTSSTSVVIKWDPPLQNETHGTIQKYIVRYGKVNCKSTSSNLTAWIFIYVNGTMMFTDIRGLKKWSCYSIQVNAVTIKKGKWSIEVQHRTSEDGKIMLILWFILHLPVTENIQVNRTPDSPSLVFSYL